MVQPTSGGGSARHIEILVEDRSGIQVVDALLHRMLPVGQHTFAIRPHRGKGELPENLSARPDRMASGLLDLLPAKLRAYVSVLDPKEAAIIVIMDSDVDWPDTLRSRLDVLCSSLSPGIPHIVGICVEEMESWLLGDSDAVLQAYPDADRIMLDAYRQDSICGTWEWLARVLLKEDALDLIRRGYPDVGRMKFEWASAIAPHLDPSRNRSPSFRRFQKDLLELLGDSP